MTGEELCSKAPTGVKKGKVPGVNEGCRRQQLKTKTPLSGP